MLLPLSGFSYEGGAKGESHEHDSVVGHGGGLVGPADHRLDETSRQEGEAVCQIRRESVPLRLREGPPSEKLTMT